MTPLGSRSPHANPVCTSKIPSRSFICPHLLGSVQLITVQAISLSFHVRAWRHHAPLERSNHPRFSLRLHPKRKAFLIRLFRPSQTVRQAPSAHLRLVRER